MNELAVIKGKSENNKEERSLEGRSSDVKMGREAETIDVRIVAIPEATDKRIPPLVGYFPSGFDPSKSSSQPDSETERSTSVKVYRNVESRNQEKPRMEVVVGVRGSAVNFVGTTYSGEATTPQLCNYALGVLDKETGVLKIVPIAANRIFRLDPRVASNKKDDTVTAEEKADRDLTSYLTKKSIRRDKKIKTLRETGDPRMQEDMEDKLKAIKVNMEALDASVSTVVNARNIPPHDMEATKVEMAYPLDRIILKGEWDYLLDIFELIQAGSEVKPDVYPSFVCNRIHKLQNVKNEEKKRRMACILSYITHLIKYKDRFSMDGVSSTKHHKLPSILSQKFLSMFGSTNDRIKRLPEEKQNLLIAYVLVLSLFADDFRSDPEDIARDLRINSLMLRTHYEYLGCKFVRENQRLIATLPVPLQFQSIKRKRKR